MEVAGAVHQGAAARRAIPPVPPARAARRLPARRCPHPHDTSRCRCTSRVKEESAPAVKLGHNLVNHVMNELEVVVPAGRPARVHRSRSVGQTKNWANRCTCQDVKLPKGVTVMHPRRRSTRPWPASRPPAGWCVRRAAEGGEAARRRRRAASKPSSGRIEETAGSPAVFFRAGFSPRGPF